MEHTIKIPNLYEAIKTKIMKDGAFVHFEIKDGNKEYILISSSGFKIKDDRVDASMV